MNLQLCSYTDLDLGLLYFFHRFDLSACFVLGSRQGILWWVVVDLERDGVLVGVVWAAMGLWCVLAASVSHSSYSLAIATEISNFECGIRSCSSNFLGFWYAFSCSNV